MARFCISRDKSWLRHRLWSLAGCGHRGWSPQVPPRAEHTHASRQAHPCTPTITPTITSTHTHASTHNHIHNHTHDHTHAHACMHTHTHVYIHAHTYAHIYTHAQSASAQPTLCRCIFPLRGCLHTNLHTGVGDARAGSSMRLSSKKLSRAHSPEILKSFSCGRQCPTKAATGEQTAHPTQATPARHAPFSPTHPCAPPPCSCQRPAASGARACWWSSQASTPARPVCMPTPGKPSGRAPPSAAATQPRLALACLPQAHPLVMVCTLQRASCPHSSSPAACPALG